MSQAEGYASSLGDKKAIACGAEERVKEREIASCCCPDLLGVGEWGLQEGVGNLVLILQKKGENSGS